MLGLGQNLEWTHPVRENEWDAQNWQRHSRAQWMRLEFGTNGESKWKTRMDYKQLYTKIYKCQHGDKKKKKEREKSKFLLLEECQPINVNQMVKTEKSLFYNSHSNTWFRKESSINSKTNRWKTVEKSGRHHLNQLCTSWYDALKRT